MTTTLAIAGYIEETFSSLSSWYLDIIAPVLTIFQNDDV